MVNFWAAISFLGSMGFWAGIAIISLIVYFFFPNRMKRRISWFIFSGLPSIAISWVVVETLKSIFKITRPCIGLDFCPTDYSFPSGHATVIFAVMTVAILYSKNRKLDISFFALATLVSLSRVFLGVHRIEDVAAGGIIGFFIGFLVYKNYKKVLNKVKWLPR